VPERQRISQRSSETLFWISRIFQLLDRIVLQHSDLDAFFFLQYIRTLLTIFISLSIIVILILVSLNFRDDNDAASLTRDLDRYSWVNIELDHIAFCWAHLMMILLVIVFICYTIYVKLLFYVHVRHAYLASSEHRLLKIINIILVIDISEKDLSILKNLYSIFPDEVRSVWINRDLSALSKKMQKWKKLIIALKITKISLITSAVTFFRQRKSRELAQLRKSNTEKKESLWKRYLKKKDRDHMYLSINEWIWMSVISLIEKKIDIIDHCLKKLTRLNKKIRADQRKLIELDSNERESSKYSRTRSIFIRFNTQFVVYMISQTLLNFAFLRLSVKHINVSVKKIRWSSLSWRWWNQYVRIELMWIVIASLLITWAILVAFTSFLSQIINLEDFMSWLRWIVNASAWLSEIIQDVLSQLMLIVLTVLLSLILRIVTSWQDLLTKTTVKLSLQKYYFVFLFVQNFLTMSFSFSITIIAQDILHGLNSALALLVRNLLKASNYFFFYLILQDLSMSADALLQVESLINWLILASWMNRTSRQKWQRQMSLSKIRWRILYSLYTNLACIDKTLTSFLTTLLTIQIWLTQSSFSLFSSSAWSSSIFFCSYFVTIYSTCLRFCTILKVNFIRQLWSNFLQRSTWWSYVW